MQIAGQLRDAFEKSRMEEQAESVLKTCHFFVNRVSVSLTRFFDRIRIRIRERLSVIRVISVLDSGRSR